MPELTQEQLNELAERLTTYWVRYNITKQVLELQDTETGQWVAFPAAVGIEIKYDPAVNEEEAGFHFKGTRIAGWVKTSKAASPSVAQVGTWAGEVEASEMEASEMGAIAAPAPRPKPAEPEEPRLGTYPNPQAAAKAAAQQTELEGKPYSIRELTDGTWRVVSAAEAGPQTLDQAILQALIAGDQETLDALLALQDRITPYQEAQFREGQAQFGATLGQRQAEERRRQLEWDMQFGATQQQRDVAQQQWQAEFGQGQYEFGATLAQRQLESNRQHQLAALQMGLDIQRSPGDLWAYMDMLGSRAPSVPYTPGEKVPRTWAEQWLQWAGFAPGGQAAPPAGAFAGGMPAPAGMPQFTTAPTSVPPRFIGAPPAETAITPYAPPGFGDPGQVAAWLEAQGITPGGGPPALEGAPSPAGMPGLEEIKKLQAQGYSLMYRGGEYAWAGPEDVDAYLGSGWAATPPYAETAAVAAPAPPSAGGPGQNLTPEQVAQQMSDQDREWREKGGQKFTDPNGDVIYVDRDDLWKFFSTPGYTPIPWPGQAFGQSAGVEAAPPAPVSGQATMTRIPQLVAPQTRAAGTFAFPGLPPQGWKAPRMEAAFRGQPVGAARQLPSLGAPVFPSGQSWGRLAPSEQQAFRGEVESQGFPWPDYMSQWRRTWPTWGTKAPFLRRPARLGV